MKKYIKPAMVQVTINNEIILAGSGAYGTDLNDTGFNKNSSALGKGRGGDIWDEDEDF